MEHHVQSTLVLFPVGTRSHGTPKHDSVGKVLREDSHHCARKRQGERGKGLSSPGSRRVASWPITVNDVLAELNLHLVPQQLELRELLPENETEAALLALLEAGGEARHVDELCRLSGLAVATVSGTLVMMELKGMVRLVGPMTYARER